MKNKILILLIILVFIASASFVSAVDDNSTQMISEVQDNDLESVDDLKELSIDNQEDVVAIENSDSDVLKEDGSKIIKMGKVTKRYNGAIEYQATFYDGSGNPLKNTKVYFEIDDSKDYEAVTDSNGIALLTVFINNGNHKIAALSTDPFAIEYDNINVFNVLTGNKNINMYYDGGNTYKVRVFGDDGKPVKAGQKVIFAVGKKIYYKKTDKNGYTKLKLLQHWDYMKLV